jgi:hypothetical protein
VALFTNTTYVDYISGNYNAEASNLRASLLLWNHQVANFSGTSSGSFASILADKDVLVMPEQEKCPATNLYTALSSAARAEIVDFVEGGGAFVFFGSGFSCGMIQNLALVNGLFGYSLATTSTGSSFTLSTSHSAGTAFQGGVSPIPGTVSATSALLRTALPSGSRSIYYSGTGDAVSLIPRGAGYVIFMGWDWYDAPPTGTAAEAGWLSVLNAAVGQAVDPTKADVALFSNTTYVDYILGNLGAEASNVQASVIDQGHRVMPFTGISSTALSRVLSGRDVLAVPEQQNGSLLSGLSTSARAQIETFVEGGGNLVVFGTPSGRRDIALINGLFGFSLAPTTCSAANTPKFLLDAAAAAGTPFQGGPSVLPDPSDTCRVNLTKLPPGSRAIYRSGNDVAVASIPVGCGSVTFMGWDWYNAEPEGSWDDGWLSVLNRALGQEERAFARNDFNGDGHSDLLWRNTSSGNSIVFLMENYAKVTGRSIGAVSPAVWRMAGTGDFNGDCKADILWRNTSSGNTIMWQMDTFSRTAASIGGPPTVWVIKGVNDYNGDGISDILWYNTSTGLSLAWQMNGFTKVAAFSMVKPATIWQIED